MRYLFLLLPLACLSLPAPKPTPVLGEVEVRTLEVHFRGLRSDQAPLFVCGWLEGGVFSCIDRQTFERELAETK